MVQKENRVPDANDVERRGRSQMVRNTKLVKLAAFAVALLMMIGSFSGGYNVTIALAEEAGEVTGPSPEEIAAAEAAAAAEEAARIAAEEEAARIAAEEEAARARKAYEKALEEYELAKSEIMHLSEESKNEILLEDYEYFICVLKTLTPQETRIYELYVEGKTTAEIAAIIGIKENTMKYHNKNIYSKLGVTSRKQFLKFASLKQYQDQKGNQAEPMIRQ